MSILVTGGAGFIGSHTVVELLNAGNEVIIVDDFTNSKPEVLEKIKKITGKDFKFYEVNLLDKENLNKIFEENKDITSVIHFAGLKAVGESIGKPIEYYHNNVTGSLILFEVMKAHNVKEIVFSSSATVYGDSGHEKLTEDLGRGKATNPYGTTKIMIEKILEDIYTSDKEWNICILRYFNPIGAHSSGIIGENPQGIPNNLMPYIMKVAVGELDHLNVFVDDYETEDGTGERDYVHVVDLARGHIKALEKLEKEKQGIYYYNLGTGHPCSVLQLVKTFERVNNVKVPYKITDRRAGDLAKLYADPSKANQELNWKAEKDIEQMCKDSWNFMKNEII